jgi:hypothetical protein
MSLIQMANIANLKIHLKTNASSTHCRVLSSPRLTHQFPNLTGTGELELIHLDRANLPSLPPDLCTLVPHLRTL